MDDRSHGNDELAMEEVRESGEEAKQVSFYDKLFRSVS